MANMHDNLKTNMAAIVNKAYWSSGFCESLIRGKFNLKINRSVKTPLHEHSRVVGSGSWVPVATQSYQENTASIAVLSFRNLPILYRYFLDFEKNSSTERAHSGISACAIAFGSSSHFTALRY